MSARKPVRLGVALQDAHEPFPRVLPDAQPSITAENIYYHGAYFTIVAKRDSIRVSVKPGEGSYAFKMGGEVREAPFTWEGAYGEDGSVLVAPVKR